MTKLDGVQTLDMTNGEITKVAYDGAEYAVAESLAGAKYGDLLYSVNYNGISTSPNSFYKIIENTGGSVRFIDDKGENGFNVGATSVKLFRKISAQTPSPTIEERVDALESDVKALKGEQQADTIAFEGAQYRKVDRKAQAGDVFVINHNEGDLPTWFTVGKPYKAIAPTDSTEEVSVIADDGDDLHVYNDGLGRTTETVDVYEKVEAEQSSYVPQEGDIVVITANTNGSRNKVGDVGKVGKITDSYTVAVDVPQRPRTYTANGNYTKFTEFRKATPAEVAQYEQALADASKPEVKAPVLKVGDYVKFEKGDIWIDANKPYEVFEDSSGFYMVDNDDDKSYMALRLYKYEILSAEEVAKHVESDKWAKIGRKVGEFKKGDIVRIIEEIGSGFIEGTLGVVAKDCNDGENSPLVKAYAADEGEIDSYYAEVELVAPVESTLI